MVVVVVVWGGGIGISFKDVVEEYCTINSLLFAPKQGKFVEGSKQIFSVGDQGGCIRGQVYIDSNVLFFRPQHQTHLHWEPISLDDLKSKISICR